MFNLYQSINKKEQDEKESPVIGHERWYQERTSRSSNKRKKIRRRAHSAAEFSDTVLTAAAKRAAFKNRSHSTEKKSDGDESKGTSQRADSISKVLFSFRRQSTQPKFEYSAVKTDAGNDKYRPESTIRNGVFVAVKRNLEDSERYELRAQLGEIGHRAEKNWFTVHDLNIGAERLLTLLPLPSTCPIIPSPQIREVFLELF
ncbi:slowpoke-binding protein-like, partial [Sitophilus oryzae]|uniref:Slowpoke-binding protein-like n=1 Tax=Sitophilus oryzae TaxID=7048 RepID=A0A6J2X1E6_SITOR